ncbi:Uncharacterised protein [Kluyvera cryocrescens]|uniref:Uncharacterized protein n=1 Tax=Kluyvera cryocrescens TaxID=580 RepID=A0A485AZ15_KLUCR|nr:Uncharacterised protein [Kluyvera cryocrescens]
MTATPITTSEIVPGSLDDKLSIREKIGYGLR